MKKILSLILAAIMIAAFSVPCFAVTTTAAQQSTTAPAQQAVQPSTTTAKALVKADDATAESAFKQFTKIIDAESEARYAVAGEAMFSLYSVLHEAFVTDYITLAAQMKKYAEDTGSEFAPVFSDMYSVQLILKQFTAEGTLDMNAVQKRIESSAALSSVLALYTGAYIVKSAAAGTPSGMVENPRTGDSSTGTVIAFAVLAVSVSAAAVCLKKKES